MPLSGCSNGLAFTALIATIFLVPIQYYGEDYYASKEPLPEPRPLLRVPFTQNVTHAWQPIDIPSVDLYFYLSFAVLLLIVYICEWIQRKLLETRILKLKQCLKESLDRLRSWEARQEHIETNIMMVQNATSEYNLLLHLLLHHAADNQKRIN